MTPPSNIIELVQELQDKLSSVSRNPVDAKEQQYAIDVFCEVANSFPVVAEALQIAVEVLGRIADGETKDFTRYDSVRCSTVASDTLSRINSLTLS